MHLAPETGIYIRHSVREELWREGFGTKFPGSEDLAETYRNELQFMQAVREAFTERGLAPRDMIDVQGALWVIHNYANEDAPARPENPMSDFEPANTLVLYGPPGTGKTFATAAEAVRLCEVDAPDDRSQLMVVYQGLLAAGRIEFVTFHQSMSYEEFVEGLRPETPAKEGQEPESDEVDTPGFRLKVEDGIFKRICERARLDPGKASDDRRLDRTRPIFKVALGRRGQEEMQIKAALDANEVRHGWSGNIDWSDERFEDWAEIKTELERTTGKDVSSHAGELVCTYSFRSDIQVGDYVVVSDGRDRMRAFGTVTSDYFFDADAEHHPHRRKVEWLWRDDRGAERARFYPNGFRQHTVCKLNGTLRVF
ncbi:hypothetical protein N1F89_03140 [Aquibium sp. A9E412]|uniref:hypothetical protein n=1 Tax=Aquibium sp. A9E412 TaxID=2976767 RepID=UPI0025B1F8E3|nr:hypothetical protein [Aquibium sp. A9E412]MDN2565204.1 hypothetical protein [Aquibium sp. A9E412]